MECAAGQKNGFVTFKKSTVFGNLNKENDNEEQSKTKFSTVKIPIHLRNQMDNMQKVSQGINEVNQNNDKNGKGSKEYRSDIEKLRAELAEIKRQKEALGAKTNNR